MTFDLDSFIPESESMRVKMLRAMSDTALNHVHQGLWVDAAPHQRVLRGEGDGLLDNTADMVLRVYEVEKELSRRKIPFYKVFPMLVSKKESSVD